MVKKIVIMLLLFSTVASAMKRAEPEEQAQCCLFALLPLELLNKIAWYLDFCETDEACIARVRKQKDVSAEHRAQLESLGLRYQYAGLRPAAYSIDRSKVIFLRTGDFQRVGDSMVAPVYVGMFDIQKTKLVSNRFENSVEAMSMATHIKGIALSNDGFMLAAVGTVKTSDYDRFGRIERMSYKDELVVKRGTTLEESKVFTLSKHADHLYHCKYKIGFNKQSTKIAVCIKEQIWKGPENVVWKKKNKTFLLVSEEEHRERSVCNLQNYFRLHRICKPLIT